MGLSTNINTYNDIRRVLDTVLAKGEVARYKTESRADAVRWRLRAYTFRKLLQRQLNETAGTIPGYSPSTPYDNMILRLDDTAVIIDMDGQAIPGELTDETGRPLSLLEADEAEVDPNDPLLLEAMKLARGDDK